MKSALAAVPIVISGRATGGSSGGPVLALDLLNAGDVWSEPVRVRVRVRVRPA